MRTIALGNHKQPGGLFVEPMDDARAFDPANSGKIAAVVEERVDQRSLGVARCGVDYQTGRFVDDKKVLILEYDIERDGFRLGIERCGFRFIDRQLVVSLYELRGLSPLAVDFDAPTVDQLAHPRTGPLGVEFGKASIESDSGEDVRNGKPVSGAHRGARRPTHQWRPTPANTISSDISWLVERAPPRTKPRAASPRVHSRKKRAMP